MKARERRNQARLKAKDRSKVKIKNQNLILNPKGWPKKDKESR